MRLFTFMGIGLFVLSVMAVPGLAHADANAAGVANTLNQDISGLITGNLGAVIGLGVSLFGLWLWLMQQNQWGLAILIFGAAITAFPGVFNSIQGGFVNAFGLDQGNTQINPGAQAKGGL